MHNLLVINDVKDPAPIVSVKYESVFEVYLTAVGNAIIINSLHTSDVFIFCLTKVTENK
jgi:hypothetical protein